MRGDRSSGLVSSLVQRRTFVLYCVYGHHNVSETRYDAMNIQTPPSLVARIRQKCTQERWYGPSTQGPEVVIVTERDPRRSAFTFPPATPDQLAATEQALGFPLSPVLRILYSELANGGFGPGYGLRGVLGGYGTPADPQGADTTILGAYPLRRKGTTPMTIARDAALWRSPDRVNGYPFVHLSSRHWPEGLLCICDLGCVQEICVDQDGHLSLETPVTHDEQGNLIEMEEENGVSHYQYQLERLPYTLTEWLARWLDGTETRFV